MNYDLSMVLRSDVSNVVTMHEMLFITRNFNGNLTGWNIEKVQCVKNLFEICANGDRDPCMTQILPMVDG